MASTWTPSRRMQAAASQEVTRLGQELARLELREAELARELESVRGARSELTGEIRMLRRLARQDSAEVEPEARPERYLRAIGPVAEDERANGAAVLRGARIRETAIRILTETSQPDQAIHYKTWFELFRQQGFTAGGKDPLATFLTQLGRSPVIQRSTAPGMYSLNLQFPEHARARVLRLHEQVRAASDLSGGAGIDEIADAQQRRAQLTAELQLAERELAEALRSLANHAQDGRTEAPRRHARA